MSMPSAGNEPLQWFQEFSNSSLMDPYSMTMFSARVPSWATPWAAA